MPFPFSNRRTLHNPFFPKYPSISISPTQPPSPQPSPPVLPKYPSSSSSSSSSSQNLPFFPLYPSPPPPPFIPSVPTFPANISSITSTPSPRSPHSTSKLVPFLFIPILALAFVILAIAFFFLRGKRGPVKKKTETPPDFHRLVPPNDRSSSKHSASSSAPHSSEILYLGTLVNSHGHVPSTHVSREMDPADSPELRPLPPLTRQNHPPPPPSPPPPPPPPPSAAVHKDINFSQNPFAECDQNINSVGRNGKILIKEIKTSTANICDDAMDASEGAMSFEELRKPKLKPLHWDKVKASSDRRMVWDLMKSSSFQLNEEMIETLFGCDTAKNTNGKDNAWRKMNLNSMCVVLDPKKSQNIAILLKALHISKDEVCDALMEGNAGNLGSELLETLLRMAPSKEEEIKLREYNSQSSYKLGPAENFLRSMLDIPFAFKRVEALLFISCFESEVHYIRKSFEVVQLACEELRDNRVFHKLLDAVLKTGNRLNVGTVRGDAKAFKLDSLLKLIDVKSTDGITTLLHFVVQEISIAEGFRANQSNSLTTELDSRKVGLNIVSNLGSELSNVKKAATMDSRMLSSYVSRLAIGIEKIQGVLRLSTGTDKFSENMIRFLKMAEVEFTRLQNQEGFVLSLVKEITVYFHGNLTKEEAHPHRIFTVVRDFLGILDQVCKDVSRDDKHNVVGGFLKIHPIQNVGSDEDSSSFSSMSS